MAQLCEQCERPQNTCLCAYIQALPTNTRIVIVQHPRERRVGIGTAKLAHLCLPNSVFRVGTDFSNDPVIQKELSKSNTFVLFPSPTALPIDQVVAQSVAHNEPVTLVIIDGTWWQARSLYRHNKVLQNLQSMSL